MASENCAVNCAVNSAENCAIIARAWSSSSVEIVSIERRIAETERTTTASEASTVASPLRRLITSGWRSAAMFAP